MALPNDPTRFENVLAKQQGAYEPQRQFQWMLRIHGLSSEDSEVIELSLKSAALPSMNNEEIMIPYLNGSVFVAGKVQYDPLSCSFNDYLDRNTAKRLQAWRQQVYNEAEHKVGLARDYKKTAELILYSPDFDSARTRTWLLEGIWPQSANFGALDMGASDVVTIEINFRYDRAIPDKGLNPSA